MKTKEKRPSDFIKDPFDSIKQKAEHEQIAFNIMLILKRTGNVFRKLSWTEYKKERLKDGNFSDGEKGYFNDVIDYCKSEDTAKLFSPNWK